VFSKHQNKTLNRWEPLAFLLFTPSSTGCLKIIYFEHDDSTFGLKVFKEELKP